MNTLLKISFVLLILFVGISKPQNFDSTNLQAGWGSLNYAVPESPAFKILGVSDNNIMRPTSTRDIGIAIGNYYINNGTTIPKNFSVEIAPSLFNPKVNMAEYRNSWTRLWYTSTYSLGTKLNNDGSYDIGLGIKIKLIDSADLRLNNSLIKFINAIGPKLTDAYEDAIKTVSMEIKNQEGRVDAKSFVINAYSDTTDKRHDEIVSRVNEKMLSTNSELLQKISEYRTTIKNSLWNAQVWDVGIAALLSSKDSLIKNLSAPSKIGLWSTLGCPLTSNGQLLIGMNTQVMDDSLGQLNQWGGNLGMRGYYGRNDTKGFLEAESNFLHSQLPTFQVGIGLETTFAGCIWIDFSLGMKKTGSQPFVFTPGLNISYATGEKNK